MKALSLLFALLLLSAVLLPTTARTRTTQTGLHANVPVAVIAPDSTDLDSSPTSVSSDAVTVRGFAKRASDSKESFLLTNNLTHRISAVRMLLRYSALDGTIIHERKVTIPVTLAPGETQLVSCRSFDTQRLYYYHAGPKPRKSATPFDVAYRLTGYDIPVGD